ncbi:MAG: hypothetical protein WAN43_17290 [Rhodomicrobium sp.]
MIGDASKAPNSAIETHDLKDNQSNDKGGNEIWRQGHQLFGTNPQIFAKKKSGHAGDEDYA